jgi:glutathione synthase/RimK-type ligase-like ATP-grasp enzyme
MPALMVVNNPKNWPLDVPGVEVVSARAYLTDPAFGSSLSTRVFNLCRSYSYQSNGYYVSLLAEARGHKPLPNVATVLDMKSQTIVRFVSEDLDDLIQKSLRGIRSEKFTLSIYFGRNLAKQHDKLSAALFKLFPSPMIRAQFAHGEEKWQLQSVGPIAASEIPQDHRPFIIDVAKEYFQSRRSIVSRRETPRFQLAILVDPDEVNPPSNEKAIQKFTKAAESLDFGVEIIDKDDYARLAEFDALFIRETTAVNHHTFRFARRAAAEGLVVVDDPDPILRCGNKVYLAELMERHKIQIPRTRILSSVEQADIVAQDLGLPLILKQPDSAFSLGVHKVTNLDRMRDEVERLLEESDLIIAQEFLPTDFDWRVGLLEGQPLFVCRYFMAADHWQIVKREDGADKDYGRVETLPVETAPQHVVKAAIKAASLIGNGLYGVDLKEIDGRPCIIEINDNPNIDAGFEDAILKDELYAMIMRVILKRVEKAKERR